MTSQGKLINGFVLGRHCELTEESILGIVDQVASRAGHLKWIVVLILQVIVVMFETTGGLVRGHLVKNSCLTVDTKFWGKWQKCSPQRANFFVCQPDRMKFLQQVSHNILGLLA